MTGLLGQRALVLGAGIGGLSIAGVLASGFERVEVLERDLLAGSPGSRTGTPQDRHPHALLVGGLRALDELFPGFADDLARAGAVSVAVAQDLQVERPDVGVVPKRDFGFSLLCASRPLIEFVLRRRIEAITNIVLRPGSRVTQIVAAEAENAVQGVRVDYGGAVRAADDRHRCRPPSPATISRPQCSPSTPTSNGGATPTRRCARVTAPHQRPR